MEVIQGARLGREDQGQTGCGMKHCRKAFPEEREIINCMWSARRLFGERAALSQPYRLLPCCLHILAIDLTREGYIHIIQHETRYLLILLQMSMYVVLSTENAFVVRYVVTGFTRKKQCSGSSSQKQISTQDKRK